MAKMALSETESVVPEIFCIFVKTSTTPFLKCDTPAVSIRLFLKLIN